MDSDDEFLLELLSAHRPSASVASARADIVIVVPVPSATSIVGASEVPASVLHDELLLDLLSAHRPSASVASARADIVVPAPSATSPAGASEVPTSVLHSPVLTSGLSESAGADDLPLSALSTSSEAHRGTPLPLVMPTLASSVVPTSCGLLVASDVAVTSGSDSAVISGLSVSTSIVGSTDRPLPSALALSAFEADDDVDSHFPVLSHCSAWSSSTTDPADAPARRRRRVSASASSSTSVSVPALASHADGAAISLISFLSDLRHFGMPWWHAWIGNGTLSYSLSVHSQYP